MLITLYFSVRLIFTFQIQEGGINNISSKEILDYRKEIIAIILTAFGAWIGAGSAYFFGRENMKEATKNFISMQELSTRGMLKTVYVKDVPPDTLDWSVKSLMII
jgi:hypothetical protein